MIDSLERQIELLEEYTTRVLKGEEAFLPEVATKLRLLLVRARMNTPLLFEVASRLGDVPMVSLREGPKMLENPPGLPPPGVPFPFEDFLASETLTVSTTAGDVSLTKIQLIRAISEQFGGAHEDWDIDEALMKALIKVPLLGLWPVAIEIRNISRATVQQGRRLIALGRERASKPEQDGA